MVEFAMARLVTSSRLRKNLTIDVHLRRHSAEGEAMLAETANPYRPREFKVIINHHALEIDHYGRTRDMTSGLMKFSRLWPMNWFTLNSMY